MPRRMASPTQRLSQSLYFRASEERKVTCHFVVCLTYLGSKPSSFLPGDDSGAPADILPVRQSGQDSHVRQRVRFPSASANVGRVFGHECPRGCRHAGLVKPFYYNCFVFMKRGCWVNDVAGCTESVGCCCGRSPVLSR